jgi:c-di-GMP-binding flagellar brake protein YcgR
MGSNSGFTARDVQIPFERLGLQVGDSLSLESPDHSVRYTVRLIGFLPNASVIVTQPLVDGRQVLLKTGRPFTARSAVRNKVFAFNTQIKHYAHQPYAYMHLEYPKTMLALEVRNAERIKVGIQAEVVSDFDTGTGEWPKKVTITDLSRTGAGVQSETMLGREGDEVKLRCTLTVADITKAFSLSSVIRSMNYVDAPLGDAQFLYGLQFYNLSEAARIVLSGFIYEQQVY